MIEVHRGKLRHFQGWLQRPQHMEQHHRIRAAGNSHQHVVTGSDQGVILDEVQDPFGEGMKIRHMLVIRRLR
jgi:hypothetical protein